MSRRFWTIWAIAIVMFSLTAPGRAAEKLGHPAESPRNWSSYYGNSRAWSYSALDQINLENVSRMSVAWSYSTGEEGLASAPLVIDGVMYLLAPRNQIHA